MGNDTARSVDFGRTAKDYALHRPGFPPAFFDRLERDGVFAPGQRLLDIGTGTGTLARGFAARGLSVVGLDPSERMLGEAEALARAEALEVEWVRASAEQTGIEERAFDIVSAGQCWHWFDRPRAAAECSRVLRAGGRMLVAYFSYLVVPGSCAEATEQLILRHNPAWPMAGGDARYPHWAADLRDAGFLDVEAFQFDLPVTFTHQGWRGRFRACNGVLALPAEQMDDFDAELGELLEARFPEPIVAPHRVYWIVGTKR